ncbi:MAG: tRNA (adenosine(37)-N6)-threonylcarbamoyltransferase complex transferase subunit TsaD [Clostridia bacterium]|nr:tRNA (adenosine(37)-N6)-threonylcarbamoyltransferase complex transferase subunit TsaD [Clostridia bacterium]
MKILAIESSCDDTSAAVVEDGRKVISCKVASQIKDHQIYGGVVPEVASRKHIENISPLVKKTIEEANCSFKTIDALAVTYAPGLVGSLLVGVNFAKGLALGTGLPLVPVHHIKSHIASLYLSNPNLKPPFLCLVVSGGHSNIIEVKDYTKFKILGRTRDDAAGEAFDKVGRRLGLAYPGGVMLDKISENGNPDSFKLPVPLSGEDTYDFSFSGIKTAMINIINNYNQKNLELPINDLAASFRKSVVDCLVSNFLRAAKENGYRTLGIAGGVSANSLLRRELNEKCRSLHYNFYEPKLNFCGDNAAMVGSQAYYEFLSGKRASMNLNARAAMPIDED